MYLIRLGYALITGFLPFTLRARFAHIKSFLQFYRRIGQTTATDGGSVDFASLQGCNLLGQRICTGRTVLGQCRSYCRGAVAKEHHIGLTHCRFLTKHSPNYCIPMKYPD